jgi:periplasmic protein TonB
MIRYNFKQNKVAHITAMAVAILLHLTLFFWLSRPSKPVPLRQSIRVTMVAPSSVKEVKKSTTLKVKQDFIKSSSSEKTNDVAKIEKEKVKEVEKEKVKEEVRKQTKNFQTSGQVDQNAVEKTAARSDPIFDAAYLQNPAPYYPKSARNRGAQGKVMLEVKVTKFGKAAAVVIKKSSGFSALDEAAKDAVEYWKFVPAYVGAEAVEATVLVPIEFKLN